MKTLEYKGQKVLTTDMLSGEFRVDSNNLVKNYTRNKKFYIEGEDFFILSGEELRQFATTFQIVMKSRTPKIYLWTESGSLNHAKSLQNTEAWEVFLKLRDGYFRQREALRQIKEVYDAHKALEEHTKRDVQVKNTKEVARKIKLEIGTDAIPDYHRKACKLHSGKTPSQLQREYLDELNKQRVAAGKKPKVSAPSGRDILREIRPEVAASMSLTDSMVSHGGVLEEIAPLSVTVQPVFLKMMELGMYNPQARIGG